jgi:small subunit ribosomal protein S8
MSMTDPISDFLTRIRNAVKANKKTVDIPASNMKKSISEILKKSAFIHDYKMLDSKNPNGVISLHLKYNDGESVIKGLRKISKPGIRRYVQNDSLPRVRNGLGIAIVSTSRGLMTDKQARESRIGGEVICEIW